MDKKILKRLMLLRNEKANKKLGSIADSIVVGIKKSKVNDEIFNGLDLIQEFVYVVPDQALEVCKFVIYQDNPNEPKPLGGKFFKNRVGMNHTDLVIKSLDILNEIRYLKTDEVLDVLLSVRNGDEKEVNNKAEEVLKNIAKYDYHILRQFGYAAQKLVLKTAEQKGASMNLLDVKIIFSELLKPSYEGSEMKDENTFSWLSGPLIVDDDLKDIRSRSIKFLVGLLRKNKVVCERIAILEILDGILRFPNRGTYKEDFEVMVAEDAKRLINEYSTVVFNKKGDLVVELPIIQEIESQLNWIIGRPIEKTKKDAEKFIKHLNQSETYRVSRFLATSIRDYRGNRDWKEAEQERQVEIDKLFETLNNQNIKKYISIFEEIGKHLDRSKSWEWHGFSNLIYRIAKDKPELANLILDNSKLLTEKFLVEILDGFRNARNWNGADKGIALAIKSKKIDMVEQVFLSIGHVGKADLRDSVRDSDLSLLENAITNMNDFKTYEIAGSDNRTIHHSLMWALIAIYNFNPKKVENLVLKEFELNREFIPLFLDDISVGMIRDQIGFDGWSKKRLKIILNSLVEIRDLDHDSQNILVEIAKTDFKEAFLVFEKRIKKEKSELPEKSKIPYSQQYDSIPNYLEEKLAGLLCEDARTLDLLYPLVLRIKGRNYPYDWRVSELCQKIGGKVYQAILDRLVASKDDNKLEIAGRLIDGPYPPGVDICMKIIANSSGSKSKVWGTIRSRLYTTGVVMGEYGIKTHYESVKEQIEKIKAKKPRDKNIQEFSELMIKGLEAQIAAEDRRVKEELLRRKIEFES